MTVLSPLMSYIVDKEVGFPIPSEKEKINKALRRYRNILAQHPSRSDAPEIMFGIADLLVGRNESGDYTKAMNLYDQILLRATPEYLRARVLVGKAELMIGSPSEFNNAISLCERARKILKSDVSDFFAAKAYIVEAELLLSRQEKGDWAKALGLINWVVREKDAHWYFRGRALLSKAEIFLYRQSPDLKAGLKSVDFALKELKSRPDDYFANKGKLIKAEILCRRGKKADFNRAEKLLLEVIKMPIKYQDLIARAKIDLADIATHPKAAKLLKQVHEMEGLDPYLIEKARLVEENLEKTKKAKKKKKRK